MIASQHVGKSQRGVEYGGIGITSPCSRLAKSALSCGPAKKQSLDLFFKSAGDEGVEITSNTFKYKVWLRGRAPSDRTAPYGLSIKTNWFSKSFLGKYSLKNQCKSRLPSRAMGRVCNPLSRKKRKEETGWLFSNSPHLKEPSLWKPWASACVPPPPGTMPVPHPISLSSLELPTAEVEIRRIRLNNKPIKTTQIPISVLNSHFRRRVRENPRALEL